MGAFPVPPVVPVPEEKRIFEPGFCLLVDETVDVSQFRFPVTVLLFEHLLLEPGRHDDAPGEGDAGAVRRPDRLGNATITRCQLPGLATTFEGEDKELGTLLLVTLGNKGKEAAARRPDRR